MFGAIAGGLGKLGGLIGGGIKARRERQAYGKALKEYDKLGIPTIDQLGGGAIESAYGSEDPALRERQMQIINDLYGIYEQEGLDDRAKARLDETRRSEDIRSRGAREAIQQGARSRGVGSSDIVDQLINAQMSSDRRAGQDTQILGDLEQRKMNALTGSGNLATSTRGQEMDKMSALDRIRQFNQTNRGNAYRAQYNAQKGLADTKAGLYTKKGIAQGQNIGQMTGFGLGSLYAGSDTLNDWGDKLKAKRSSRNAGPGNGWGAY